ncbi:MAG: carboxypeptidase regulatory-like domain-containing protein [Acidobacteria bacterium]|nr:carboxypeptidase regulatory-like domain-containing protein [Acidobacteriota bacterium]MBS1866323.1 carboxypeptidase regulatory-like domain-containing protein [Acidobacteriota bacterium]
MQKFQVFSSVVLRCALALLSACALLAVFAGVVPTSAQSTNAQITGVVADSSGGAIVEALVSATNLNTGVVYTSTTNEAGLYVEPELVPGPYQIIVSKQGFGTVTQPRVVLRTGDHVTLNFTLKPGTLQEAVTVTGESVPIISMDQASSSHVLDNKMITELPQLNRNTLDLAAVTPAIQGKGPLSNNIESLGNASYLIANNGNSYAVSGGQVNGTSISVDGNQLQDAEFNAVNRSIPTPDTIGEFRVESGVLTAEHGRYSGGIISINTQSGTNLFHGRLFEYFRNQALNSNEWMSNALGVEKQPFHQNNYGASLGGPVYIPKLYSGKNRTFFFFGWEGERFSKKQNVQSSVPSLDERNGYFGSTIINYQNGNPVYAKIYDPFNGYMDGSGNWVRPEFPNDTIPTTAVTVPGQTTTFSQQSQLFLKYLPLWPEPNHAPAANTDHTNNYYSAISFQRPSDRYFFRIDHNFSNNHRLNFSFSRSSLTNLIGAPFFHAAASVTTDHDWSSAVNYTWVLSPTSILDVHLGFGVAKLVSTGVSGWGAQADPNIDTSQWPFDPLIINNPEKTTTQIPPGLSISGYTGIGGSEFDSFINQTVNGTVAFTKVLHRHTLKFGYEQYFARFDENGGDHTGVAWVNAGGGSNEFWNNNDGLTGSPLAELMMGSSNFFQWGNWNIAPYGYNQAAYVMDDWKVNNKLTVQIGLRWDHDGARQSRYPKGSLMYDQFAKNVLTPNAGWDWSQVTSTVPGLSSLPEPAWLSQGATGRVVLLDTPEYPQKNLYKTDWLNFQPRLGISYAFNNNTVLHAGAGIIYQGLNGLSTDWFSFYYNSITFNQLATLNGQQWVSEFGNDHGLGTFPLQSSGANLGYFPPVTTNAAYGYQTFGAAANLDQAGTTIGHFNSPEDYMWTASLQRQLGKNWTFTVEYTGIRGIHLLMPVWNWSTNNIPLDYYKLGQHLNDQVPNPFYGQSQTFSSQPTLPLSQLLGLSPQYTNLSPGQATWGKSLSNFVNFQAQTRRYHGLALLASYSIRKTLTNTGGKDIQHSGPAGRGILQNPHDLMEGYGLALYEQPQTLLLNYSYDLPFGRGRRFLSGGSGWSQRLTDAFLGGWGLAGVSTYHPKGTPVLVPNVSGGTTAPGAALRWSLDPGAKYTASTDYSRALAVNGSFTNTNPLGVFNSAAFVRTPDYSLSNAAFVFPNVRNPGDFSTDATMLKKFYFSQSETRWVEFRVEALNIFNHPNYGFIDNNPDSPTFGGINGKAGSRTMQLGLRIFF